MGKRERPTSIQRYVKVRGKTFYRARTNEEIAQAIAKARIRREAMRPYADASTNAEAALSLIKPRGGGK